MDLSVARTNMVKSQIIPNGVNDEKLLGAMTATPREAFVAATHKEFAYSDSFLPLSATRRCLKPLQVARLVQALAVKPGQKVLLAGAGTGYEAVLLAGLGASVFAVEADTELLEQGKQLTAASTVRWLRGDPEQGWPDNKPYDAILLLGSVETIPDELLAQLDSSGVLVAMVGKTSNGKEESTLKQVVRIKGHHKFHPEVLFETFAFALTTEPQPQRFVL